MADNQGCLFCRDAGCGACGGSLDPVKLDDCICVIETATGRVVQQCAFHADEAAVTTRCTGCCDEPRQCAKCAAIDAGDVVVSVDVETHNVVGIFDRRPVAGTLQDVSDQPFITEVIDLLESLLERARAGEFTGVAAVLDGSEGLVTLATSGAVEDPIIYLGGLSRVAHQIQLEADADED